MNNDIDDVSQLQFAEYNPRTINKHDFGKLKQSLARFGDLSCIVRNVRTNNLVGGHQRIRATQEIGSATIEYTEKFDTPTKLGTVARGYVKLGDESYAYREVDWDEQFEKAANVAANRIQGEFHEDMLAELVAGLDDSLRDLTGQTQEEIDSLLDLVGLVEEVQEDEVEVDESVPAVSEFGAIYQLGNHRLMCGDSTAVGDVGELLNGAEIDMIFTDPPYGVSYQDMKGTYSKIANDDIDPTQVIIDAYSMLGLNKNAPVYLCCNWESLEYMRRAARGLAIEEKAVIVWDKKHGVQNLDKYFKQHEFILYCGPYGGQKTLRGDVWEVARQTDPDHPTPKPIELCAIAIQDSVGRDKNVADFFGGSGSTLMACEQTGRICYMMELDPKYVDVIRKRYAKHIGQEESWIEATPCINAEDVTDGASFA